MRSRGMAAPGPARLLVLAIVLLLFAAPASARILIPLDRLQDFDEYAHVGFDEGETRSSQGNWGRGVEAVITVGDSCNRPDDHAIASWVSMHVFDANGNPTSWHQAGWDQNWDTRNCGVARAFYQSCTMPCNRASHYTPIQFYSVQDVPPEGLSGLFRLVIHDTTGDNPPAACLSMTTVATAVDVRCPIVATPQEASYYSCLYMAQQADANVACDVTALEEMQTLAAQADSCTDVADELHPYLERLNLCQSVLAAQTILAGELPSCDDERPLPTLGTMDYPICVETEEQAADAAIRTGPCYVVFYLDKTQMTPDFANVSDCHAAASTRVEYEAAPDLGQNHVGPGSSDEPVEFTQWRYIGLNGVSLVDDADLSFYSIVRGSNACPPYEGRYKVSSGLVNWVELGPRIGGSTNWCGQEYTVGTPGFGVIAGAAAIAGAALARRRVVGKT